MDLKQNYNPQKRDFYREKVLFSPPLPLKSLRNTGAEQSSIATVDSIASGSSDERLVFLGGATLLLLSARRL